MCVITDCLLIGVLERMITFYKGEVEYIGRGYRYRQ